MRAERPDTGFWSANAVVLLLVGSLAAAALLGVQGYRAIRSHRAVVDATLSDYAVLATQRLVAALDAEFRILVLDGIDAARSIDWRRPGSEAPSARGALRDEWVRFYFQVDPDSDTLRMVGLQATNEAGEWAKNAVTRHLREVLPGPAPYAIVSTYIEGRHVAAVYQVENYGSDRGFARGFVLDISALEPFFRRTFNETWLLPGSVAPGVDSPNSLLFARIEVPEGAVLFESPYGVPSKFASLPMLAGRASGLSVRVSIAEGYEGAFVVQSFGAVEAEVIAVLFAINALLVFAALHVFRERRRAMREREAFLINVSHELRTPLSQIRMFAETLLLDRATSPDVRDRALRVIDSESQRLSLLVDNVLCLTRQEQRKHVLHPVETSLAETLGTVVDGFSPIMERSESQVHWHIEGQPTVHVDPDALRQILVNLVDNAIKYGPAGQTVSIEVVADPAQLEIAVTDEGPGVPAEESEMIFDRFYRGDRGGPGAGIGLSVVTNLVTAIGGTITYAPAPGGGACFTVTLRLDAAQVGEGVREGARPHSEMGSR